MIKQWMSVMVTTFWLAFCYGLEKIGKWNLMVYFDLLSCRDMDNSSSNHSKLFQVMFVFSFDARLWGGTGMPRDLMTLFHTFPYWLCECEWDSSGSLVSKKYFSL